MNSSRWLSLILRLALGTQLVWGGWQKATSFEWWRDLVGQMQLFPDHSVGPLAGILPGIEILVGALLLLGAFQRAAAWTSMLLFAVFAVVLSALVLKDAPQMCGCFGPGSEYPVDWSHVAYDAGWFLCSLALCALPKHSLSLGTR